MPTRDPTETSPDTGEFFAALQRDLMRHLAGDVVFVKPTSDEDAALDRIFALMKPHADAVIQEAVGAGILERET